MAGYREEFDQALAAIEAEVIELFVMITEDLPRATALLNGNAGALATLTRAACPPGRTPVSRISRAN